MKKYQNIALFGARVSVGWLFFYSGITKVLNPDWSAESYIAAAKNFSGFYGWLAGPEVISYANFLSQWGLTLVGASLILGLFVRWSSLAGALLMLLFYIPILDFPYPNAHSYIVDQHIVYIFTLMVLSAFSAGKVWGLDGRFKKNNPSRWEF